MLVTNVVLAQKTYKTEFDNSSTSSMEISLNANKVTIIGHDKNEIIIESLGTKTLDKEKDEYIKQQEKGDERPERAEGLKPLTPTMNDNTGLGIMVEKQGNHIRISSKMFMISDQYKITVPNKVKLVINDVYHYTESKFNYELSNLENELNVTSINSNFTIDNISGPLVLNTTNGNVEVKYRELKTTKPISIVTVNGYVDLTLPASVKADVQFQTIQGKAYTDFDIQSGDDNSGMTFPNMEMFLLNGKINGGGVKININSVNGDIYLRKKKV